MNTVPSQQNVYLGFGDTINNACMPFVCGARFLMSTISAASRQTPPVTSAHFGMRLAGYLLWGILGHLHLYEGRLREKRLQEQSRREQELGRRKMLVSTTSRMLSKVGPVHISSSLPHPHALIEACTASAALLR